MKIKCPQCSFENLEGSTFCQECGYNLRSKKPQPITSKITTSIHEEIEKIDDVIFKPKKKGVLKKIIAWILIIGVVGFVGLILLASLPAEEVDTTSSQSEAQSDPEVFPITYLNITDYEIIYDDYAESYFTGTLKNAYSKAALNVKVRLDFFHDEAMKRIFDTRNVVIQNGAEANGAFSFEIALSFNPQGVYWWFLKIEGADYGL